MAATMTERVTYHLTEKQASYPLTVAQPSNDAIKVEAKRIHRPWGLVKRDLALKALRGTRDYTLGMWQGRVDAARGCEYSDERFSENYNLGYHDGYLNYASNRRGWDTGTRERFDEQYVN